ncbi:TonB-linked outer membrane protein, SusC/RagA family [Chitinophaga sp. CF118]|uniref:SusC/RagA family TonB-linked outer membrane protein n=1 Tax=Chitinophaga sp. CF118 TaxID=1884367 RepID=UPI0008EA33E8|nr:SusC/RagA family TonB-linked outer membrane protein [Chitinophaga sp. CF118]SFF07009.1 TonB-linked outer membrane protein, SusC/RagA family [Chitinophaga sp. CF118]
MSYSIHTRYGMSFIFGESQYSREQIVKCIVVMKLTLLLIFLSLQVSAVAMTQQISLNVKNAKLIDVLLTIGKQTGYGFVLNSDDMKTANPVNINLKSASIETTLQSLFENQPFNYKIQGKVIMVQHKDSEKKTKDLVVPTQQTDLNGRVTDIDGQALIGASVLLKGTQQGTVTDQQGRFSLANVPTNGTLLIRMIGRETKEVNYKNRVVPNIILREVNANLTEVQIIAYGEVQKKFSTSNIGSISGETISRQPVSNPLLALQGRITGLFIQQNSGVSGAAVSVNIQGRNSLTKGNVPFYVIDGVPYTPNAIVSDQGSVMPGVLGDAGTSNLNFINPNDIESITVLKDADATVIYGSRAANGAILITTKKGKSGQTKVDLNLQTGWGKVARRPELLNTQQYLELRREAKKNGNSPVFPWEYDISGVWDTTRNVDWQEELIGGTAQFQNLQASISGGNDRTQFLAGMGYIRETPVFVGDFSNVKSSVHFNINHASQNHKFKFFLSGSYLQGVNKLPSSDLTNNATTLPPNAPALYNEDGTLNWAPDPADPNTYTFENPAAALLRTYTDKSQNLISNSQISYELAPGLILKSSFGYNRLQSDELSVSPLISVIPSDRPYTKRTAGYSDRNIESWIVEPQLTFNKSYTFGTFEGLLGATFQQTCNDLLALRGFDYSSDALLPDLNAAGTKNTIGTLQSTYRYSAVFGRLNYRYKDRYIINFTTRRDGSSRFGSENLFHSFYSVGGAWLFSEEDFFRNVIPSLNYGKLRATYGTTGNDQIGEYSFYSLYDNYSVGIPYQGTIGLNPRGLSNPYLQWEETRKLNLGVDLGFFNSRILINANYFRNQSSNQLLGQKLSAVTGFSGIARNFPATVQNTGLELTVDYTPVKTSYFTWQGSANLTLPKNKLVRYDGLDESGDKDIYVIGQPITVRKAYAYAGVNTETGLYQFKDMKGGLTSRPNDLTDKIILINIDPIWYGGLSNTFSYKGFNLDIFIQFVKQTLPSNRFGSFPGVAGTNQFTNVLNRWHKPGEQAEIQKVTTNFGEIFAPTFAAFNSDASYSIATYARLKNVSLSYTFNSNLTRKAHISNARIYVQGQNLLTITKFLGGGDPETRNLGTLGPLRIFTLGTQLTF